MSGFSIDFVIDPLEQDERGALPYRSAALVDPAPLLTKMILADRDGLSGGFCLVAEGRVWNAAPPVPYDPRAAHCMADRVVDALLFVQAVVHGALDNRGVDAYFTEMLTVGVWPDGRGGVRLTGARAILPEIVVPAALFYGQLLAASLAFLGFASRLLDEQPPQALRERLKLGEWAAAVGGLYRAIPR